MIPCMVTHLMSLCDLTLEDLRVGFDHLPHHKEGGMNMTLLEDIEEFWRVECVRAVGPWTIIEGHRNVGAIDMNRADATPVRTGSC